jgi:hypothetical protein
LADGKHGKNPFFLTSEIFSEKEIYNFETKVILEVFNHQKVRKENSKKLPHF